MNLHAELRGFWHLFHNHCHNPQPIDRLGFGFSRSDTEPTPPAPVPDGVDLYFFTGRTHREVTR